MTETQIACVQDLTLSERQDVLSSLLLSFDNGRGAEYRDFLRRQVLW